ncbi:MULTISPECIES: hypothetical protein [unclassified Streptomyces]|uniref:hypothetical protein n=1 Tax=unclassified Streptomyces TaxID=2593676 RepID=UPI00081DD65B|nr:MULTISPECIES: hypothetical protein [unclassified Streptomyces]MYZ36162.1 hypothetical protein [Streptomyces sp. SID4917]SCF81404.1 hypothetical protein GA0115259_1029910 [Streptomyces sp. MnatMP-M17]
MRRVLSPAVRPDDGTAPDRSGGDGREHRNGHGSRAAHEARETLRTEFPFELPRGYVDESGTVHRSGVMRLATARDELIPLRDDRVRENAAYLSVVLIARVVSRIGTVEDIHPGVIEDLFASDLAFLQDFYRRINAEGHTRAAVTCPSCQESFAVDLAGGGRPGES